MSNSPVGVPSTTVNANKTSVLAIVALVLAFLIPLVGAILGFVARAQINRTGERGRGLATAAIIIGIVLVVLGLIGYAAVLPAIMNNMHTTN